MRIILKKRILTMTPALVLLIAGCTALEGVNVGTGVSLPGGIGVGANKTIGRGQEPARSTKKKEPSKPGVKLYVFDCGLLRLEDISGFGLSNTDTDVRQMFVPCYLIEHPSQGRLLWDAGLPLALVGQGVQDYAAGMTQEYRESLIDQMRSMRLSPSDVDFVAFSHMHFDHVGAANEFVDATLLIQETEYEAAFKQHADNPIFDFELYKDLTQSTKTLLSGDHDVFGDGSVRIISTPGHTPGHQVLYLELEKMGPLMLGGDLYHFQASRKLRAVPTFNTSRDQTLASMDKVESLIEVTNATLWIEHDMALAYRLNLAPSFYE